MPRSNTSKVPAKKTKTSTKKFRRVSAVRSQTVRDITEAVEQAESLDSSLEHLQSATHALVRVNEEIWKRVEDSVAADNDDFGNLFGSRMSVEEVSIENTSEGVCFTVYEDRENKSFGSWPRFPDKIWRNEKISKLFQLKHAGTEKEIPEYSDLLENLYLLNDDVMQICLVLYKEFLEQVQVFLGGIESWLTEKVESVEFVKLLDRKFTSSPTSSYQSQVLKTSYKIPETMAIEDTFHIGDDDEQKRLLAFVDYLKICDETQAPKSLR